MHGNLEFATYARVWGWAWDRSCPAERLRLQIIDNGIVIAEIVADQLRSDLERTGIGDGRHGFEWSAAGRLHSSIRHVIEVRRVGGSISLWGSPKIIPADENNSRPAGNIDSASRYMISGWAWDETKPNQPVWLELFDGGSRFARVLANRYRQDLSDAGFGDGRHAFELNIGSSLSATERHVIDVIREFDGRKLAGSPFIIAPTSAFDADLKRMVSDAVNGLSTLEDHEHALPFLAEQIEQVAQKRADLQGKRRERFEYRYIQRRGPAHSPLVLGDADPSSSLSMKAVLRALVIDDLTPDPGRDAGSQAILSHMRALQNLGYEVSFVAADEFTAKSDTAGVLEGMGVHNLGPPYYGSVEEVIRRQSDCLDLVYFHRISNASKYMAVARRYCPKARLLYSVADLHHSRIAAQAKVEERPELMALSRRTRLLECTASWLADAVLTHSPEEARWLREAVPGANVYLAPWEVLECPVETPFAQRRGLAFIGGYAHSPNIDAARFLVEEVMPLVWEKDPTIECVLAGSGMPEIITQLAGTNVKVVGHVPDLAALFSKLRLTVAPLRYGAGINGKVLASFAAGLPCVMTQTAAEGLELFPPLDQLVAVSANELAAQILRFHDSEVLSREVGDAALSFIRTRHNKEEVEGALKAAIDGIRR